MLRSSWSWLFVGLLWLAPHLAHAQLVNAVSRDPRFLVQFDHPQSSDGGTIDCVYPQGGCKPFNRAMCNNPLPIRMVISRGTGLTTTVTPGSSISGYAWLQKNSGVCSNAPFVGDPNISSIAPIPPSCSNSTQSCITKVPLTTTTQSVLLYPTGITPLVIPDDFSTGVLTTQDIMQAFPEVCDPNVGVPFTLFKICFGAPTAGGTYINSGTATVNTQSTDIAGFWQFPIKTTLPLSPGPINAKSLVSRVQLDIAYDTASQDAYGVNVIWTSDPNLQSIQDCSQWASLGKVDGSITNTVTQTGGSTSVTIDGQNGVTYAYCAQTIDLLGNASVFSAPVYASPHPECDFFDCYPGDLTVGFCGAGLTPGWFAAMLGVFVAVRSARRRRLS